MVSTGPIAGEGETRLARISRFRKIAAPRNRVHRTAVDCGYATVQTRLGRYLQLETYGSDERQIPGKVSQTLQLDRDRCRELLKLMLSLNSQDPLEHPVVGRFRC